MLIKVIEKNEFCQIVTFQGGGNTTQFATISNTEKRSLGDLLKQSKYIHLLSF